MPRERLLFEVTDTDRELYKLCIRCGWELKEDLSGCMRGNCSQRPAPDIRQDILVAHLRVELAKARAEGRGIGLGEAQALAVGTRVSKLISAHMAQLVVDGLVVDPLQTTSTRKQ